VGNHLSDAFRLRRLNRTVYAPCLLHAVGVGMLEPAIPLFALQLDVPLGLIGLLVAVRAVGGVLADVPAGILVSRLGGRAVMAIGVATSATGAVVLGLSQTPLQLFLAAPLVGVGLATWGTAVLAYVAREAPVEWRGRALALVGGSARVGMTAGPILGGVLSVAFGIQAAFFGHAAFALLAFALIATGRRGASLPDSTGEERAYRRVLQTVVEHRQKFATAGSVALSLAMVRRARSVLIPLWGSWLGLDLDEIGLVIGLASAIDMTLFYPVGMVMDRWGRKWTIIPCLLTLSLAMGLVPFTQGFLSFLLVGLLGGIGNGLGSGAVMTLGADLAPRERSGEFLGVWRLIPDSGGVVAPALVGALAQAFTLGAAFFAASAIGVGGAVLLALCVPEGLHRGRDPDHNGG
jgi:MFS family permease